VTDSGEGSARWSQVLALFERLLDSDVPEAELSRESDQEIRAEAKRLWQHHLQAESEKFLSEMQPFAVPPLFYRGQILASRFRVEGLLGAGGMGEVYLASDLRLNEKVAIKTIARFLEQSDSMRRRFLAEVQSARRVTHANVCRIYDVFDDGEIPFFAMEYINGEPLAAFLKNQKPSRSEAKTVVRQMAEGLYAAHRAGIVHGDLKPGNVMVVPVPLRAVITDFGLARAFAGSAPTAGDRARSIAGGTLEYMSPELIAGGEPSVSSDIYAFGRVAEKLMGDERIWMDCVRAEPERRPKSLEPIIKRLHHSGARRYFLGAILAAAATGAAVYKLKPTSTAWQGLEFGARLLVNGFTHVQGDLQAARLARSIFLTGLIQSNSTSDFACRGGSAAPSARGGAGALLD
jgi:predicted Ser/Thr protein kinase